MLEYQSKINKMHHLISTHSELFIEKNDSLANYAEIRNCMNDKLLGVAEGFKIRTAREFQLDGFKITIS